MPDIYEIGSNIQYMIEMEEHTQQAIEVISKENSSMQTEITLIQNASNEHDEEEKKVEFGR